MSSSNAGRESLVQRFAEQMRHELDLPVNTAKGDYWALLPIEDHLHEVVYHWVKLLRAVKSKDLAGIREFSADTANHLAMLADAFGVLDDPDYTPSEYHNEGARETAAAVLSISGEQSEGE